MTAAEIYRVEAEQRGLRKRRPRVPLAALARDLRITRRALSNYVRCGILRAVQVNGGPNGWRWEVEPEEAERFLREFRRSARTGRPRHS